MLFALAACENTPSTPEGASQSGKSASSDPKEEIPLSDKLHSAQTQVGQAQELVTKIAELNDALAEALKNSGQQDDLDQLAESLDTAGSTLASIDEDAPKNGAKPEDLQKAADAEIGNLKDVLFVLRDYGETLDGLKVPDSQKKAVDAINETLNSAIDATAGALTALGGKDEDEEDAPSDTVVESQAAR